ncbi:hypothetical protein QOZ80_1BG0082320 [Eleusine coracana subsp. coracana]|nr:hypothetical protein QOZ80_1BG0082320 [Eleusine coracana subsp. coracana]
MHLREAMETASASSGTGTGGRKKLKHRLAAILSAFSRRGGGRKRRDSQEEAEKTPPPPLAFPYYSRLGNGIGKKLHGGGTVQQPRRFSVSAPRAPPLLHITIDCAGRRSVDAADPSILPLPFPPLDADSNVNRKAGGGGEWEGRKCPPSSPFVAAHLPPLPPVARWRERGSNTTNSSSSRRHSTHTSSSYSRRERTLMVASSSSSDDEADSRRNLFSSRSFSSDSSDFYNCPLSRTNTTTTTRARASISGPCRAPPQSTSRRGASQSCRYSFELPRGSTASDGGFAVVKRSADPYEDFRKSMHEMIAEWPAEEDGAERLLETYLVLNSPRHYPAILAAFADVRETLFP